MVFNNGGGFSSTQVDNRKLLLLLVTPQGQSASVAATYEEVRVLLNELARKLASALEKEKHASEST